MQPEATIQVHPTRTAPACNSCAHLVIDVYRNRGLCAHPGTPRHPLTGEAVMRVEHMRSHHRKLSEAMGAVAYCGPAAALFAPKASAAEIDGHESRSDGLKPGPNLAQAAADVVAQHVGQTVGAASTQERDDQLGVIRRVASAELRVD